MPSKRKKGKRSFGFYWEESEIGMLKKSAESFGLDMCSFVKLLVHAQADALKTGETFEAYARRIQAEARSAGLEFDDFIKQQFTDKPKTKGETR